MELSDSYSQKYNLKGFTNTKLHLEPWRVTGALLTQMGHAFAPRCLTLGLQPFHKEAAENGSGCAQKATRDKFSPTLPAVICPHQ